MSLCKFRVLAHLSAQSEVSQLDIIILVDEQISRFDIPMENFASFSIFA